MVWYFFYRNWKRHNFLDNNAEEYFKSGKTIDNVENDGKLRKWTYYDLEKIIQDDSPVEDCHIYFPETGSTEKIMKCWESSRKLYRDNCKCFTFNENVK